MKKIYKQTDIPKQITDVFHFLHIKSNHLIGASKYKNILYTNDYDLNEIYEINDSIVILNKLYLFFKNIFIKAKDNQDYYIIDFKNGIDKDGNAIRWKYDNIINNNNDGYTFQQCLLHENNKIKLDLCYLFNHVLFTDINILYIFVITNDKKYKDKNEHIKTLKDDIIKLKNDGQIFKMIKRMYALSFMQNKTDENLLKIINSNYGMLYKLIESLKFINLMITQQFKTVSLKLIKMNLDFIYLNSNKIIFDNINLDEMNEIMKLNNIHEIHNKLVFYIMELEYFLNSESKNLFDDNNKIKIYGGKIEGNTLKKILENSYNKNPKNINNINGYIQDKKLSGERAQVYHNPETNHLVISHRGTNDLNDVITDAKLIFGYKNNNRFNHGKKITNDAINKYNTDNITIVGHSLGSQIARESNKNNYEMININPAILPSDLLKNNKDNEIIIKSKYDPISVLHEFNKSDNTIYVNNKSLNPLKQHSIDETLKNVNYSIE